MVLKSGLKRISNGAASLILLIVITVPILIQGTALAAGSLSDISLNLSTGTTPSYTNDNGGGGTGIPDGGSMPGASANHAFSFKVPDTTTVDAIEFQYCTIEIVAANGTCPNATPDDRPVGMFAYDTTNNANFGLGGVDGTGWTIDTTDSTSPNVVVLHGTATTLVAAAGDIATFTLDNVKNPTTTNTTFYVHITTYAGPITGAPVDAGNIAASTANPIYLQGTMPETLVFCTGQYIDINVSGVPDCTTATVDHVPFNELFDPNKTAWATSQMAAATNAGSGYAITVNGPTLSFGACANPVTSTGGDCINPISTADYSRPDTRQFGMNLMDDSAPTLKEPDGTTAIAADPTIGPLSTNPITYFESDGTTPDPNGGQVFPVSEGNNFTGVADTGFDGYWPGATQANDPNNYPTYSFTPNAATLVASSDWENTIGGGTAAYVHASGTGGPTDTQRYTATYIVNVSGNQPAGTYTTTLTYICTPTF